MSQARDDKFPPQVTTLCQQGLLTHVKCEGHALGTGSASLAVAVSDKCTPRSSRMYLLVSQSTRCAIGRDLAELFARRGGRVRALRLLFRENSPSWPRRHGLRKAERHRALLDIRLGGARRYVCGLHVQRTATQGLLCAYAACMSMSLCIT